MTDKVKKKAKIVIGKPKAKPSSPNIDELFNKINGLENRLLSVEQKMSSIKEDES